MKLSLGLVWAAGCSLAAAFGIRGAAERAMLFGMYVAEEIWEDSDSAKRVIATGCIGSRTGIRGQAKRCTLAEFCTHLWAPTEGQVRDAAKQLVMEPDGSGGTRPRRALDTKPAVTDGNWKMKEFGQLDIFQLVSGIQKVEIPDTPGQTPPSHYTGNINTGNVIAGCNDYYDLIRNAGAHSTPTLDEIDRILEANKQEPDRKKKPLTEGQAKNLKKWKEQSILGAELVYELRLKEDMEFKSRPPAIPGNGPPPRSLESYYGHPIELAENSLASRTDPNKPKNYNSAFTSEHRTKVQGLGLLKYKRLDKEATTNQWDIYGFKSKAEAIKAWDGAELKCYRQPGAGPHQQALRAAENTKVAMLTKLPALGQGVSAPSCNP